LSSLLCLFNSVSSPPVYFHLFPLFPCPLFYFLPFSYFLSSHSHCHLLISFVVRPLSIQVFHSLTFLSIFFVIYLNFPIQFSFI
jgi:hypothetical protein